MMSIINEYEVQKTTKRNAGVKRVLMTQSKIARSLHPSYLQPHKNQRSLSQIGRGPTTAPGLFTILHELT